MRHAAREGSEMEGRGRRDGDKNGRKRRGSKRTAVYDPLSGPRYRGSNPCLPANSIPSATSAYGIIRYQAADPPRYRARRRLTLVVDTLRLGARFDSRRADETRMRRGARGHVAAGMCRADCAAGTSRSEARSSDRSVTPFERGRSPRSTLHPTESGSQARASLDRSASSRRAARRRTG